MHPLSKKEKNMPNTQMLNYIKETPEVANKLVVDFINKINEKSIPKVDNIIFVGSGSSKNIATVATLFYENTLHMNVKAFHPDSFLDLNKINLNNKDTLIVGISETGTSTGTVEALKKAKKEGFVTIALTERRDTPLMDEGDFYFNFDSGEEKCNAKTKGYTNSLILLYLIGLKISKLVTDKLIQDVIAEIKGAINEIPKTIESFDDWFNENLNWVLLDNLMVVGDSNYVGAVEEGSLKVSETTLVPSRYSSIGEFSHGLHRTLNNRTNIILINGPSGDLHDTYDYLVKKVSRVLMIDTLNNNSLGDIKIKNRPYNLSAINIGVIFQMMAYRIPTYVNEEPNAVVNHDYETLVHNRI